MTILAGCLVAARASQPVGIPAAAAARGEAGRGGERRTSSDRGRVSG
jgi:hypothetical protein